MVLMECINEISQCPTKQERLPACESKNWRRLAYMTGDITRFIDEPGVVMARRRLRTHHAPAIASIGQENGVVQIRLPEQHL
jgi:hypothetical protein